MPSRAGWPTEAPCIDCGTRTEGLLLGERCPMCQVRRQRHASRLAGKVALGAAVLMAGYLAWRPLPGGTTGRVYAGVAVLITYLLVRKIAAVIAIQMLPNHTDTTE
jgi:hypothetical protein